MTTPKMAYEKLKRAALEYPGAELAVILGDHEVVRVRDKVFLWLGNEDGGCHAGLRLPWSQDAAMMLPFVEPMGYGMAKWGWVSASFRKGQDVPLDLLLRWLRESYRKVAPRKLAALLDGAAPEGSSKPPRGTARRSSARRPARPRSRAS